MLSDLPVEKLEEMVTAGQEVLECHRVLNKGKSNIVAELLRGQGTFYQMDHYPKGDVYDNETHSQYYYHSHREQEHGHFHTFVREEGMPEGILPVTDQSDAPYFNDRDDKICHLICVSMDRNGLPLGLFTTNRWVTAENWYSADDVIKLLDHFNMDLSYPSWPANRWITAMLKLYRPQIEILVRQRDENIAKRQVDHPDTDVFEDREFEITSIADINLSEDIQAVNDAYEAATAKAAQ